METIPGGVAGWSGPGAGLGGPPAAGVERTIRSRLAQAAVLALLAALAGGLTYAMAHEVGLAALTGRKALARAAHCRGARARTCDAVITDPGGNIITVEATLSGFTRVAD
ncbi:MAG TPA: hypothetical protein VGP90_13480, partial [Acidimicrobiia bacterium]|nr:hypothetical protein [Acidimicrobiia bacterium]